MPGAPCPSGIGKAVSAILAAAVLASPPPARAGERLNVLLICIDDLGCSLGCYGHPQVRSPRIDALADRGLRFDRAYCQYPVCNPSRTSFLTGLRPDRTGVLDNTTFFRDRIPDVVTLPQHFRLNGYHTMRLGKVFHGAATAEDPKAWDSAAYPEGTATGRAGAGRNLTGGTLKWCSWLSAEGGDEDQPDGRIACEAVRLLEEHRDRPFFLACGFHKPHDPFVAPAPYFNLYPSHALRLAAEPSDRTPDPPLALPAGMKAVFDRFADAERREFLRAYYACTSFTDAQVGRVLDALDRLKLAERTLVILLGDNGYHLGERGWWNKNTNFELSARCPLIVLAPGMKAQGRSCARLVEFVDLYPTLVDLCGLPAPPHLEGRSFRPLLDDPAQPWKTAAWTQVQRGPVAGYSLRTERWRYTEWDGGKQGVELYDHETDPGEWKNLADRPEMKETIDGLQAMMRERGRAR